MVKFGAGRSIAVLAALATALPLPASAQDAVQMVVIKGATPERPFTLIYPEVLETVDDGSDVTVATLRHPDAVLQCDAMVENAPASDWSAERALETLDTGAIVASWTPDFPGFRLTSQGLTSFQSGPALIFEGESDSSPFDLPLHIVHAEAMDSGRYYAIECLVDRAAAPEARPMIDFLIANFSTRDDGVCCTDPADPRG